MSELKICKTELGKLSWYHKLYINDELISNEFNSYQDPRLRMNQMGLPDLKDRSVLDLGCASGGVSFELARRGAITFGIDSNKETIEALNCLNNRYKFSNLEFLQMDIASDIFFNWLENNKPFDIVFMLRILGWVNGKTPDETISIRKRILTELSKTTNVIYYESINNEQHDVLMETLKSYGVFGNISTIYKDYRDKSDTPSLSDKQYCLFRCEVKQ